MAAEVAISAAVQLLGELLGKLLAEKLKSSGGVEGKIDKLKEELNWMRSFLSDADKTQAPNDRVRNWIIDIREVALDTEDVINLFNINLENSRRRSGPNGFLSRIVFSDQTGEEIDAILDKLKTIANRREIYGIKNLGELGEPPRRSLVEAMRWLDPSDKDEHPVGMEEDVNKLVEHIMDKENKGLSVAAVVGMGGIGKSTLAREVYNHPDVVSGQFDCRAWIVVSREFTPEETTKQLILQMCTSGTERQQQLEEIKQLKRMKDQVIEMNLKRLLIKLLEGKTYFIVLDDVWEKEHWDWLMSALSNGKDKTRRLLLTTRNSDIIKDCQCLHKLNFLDDEKSWELFLKKGLTGNSHREFPKELESLGREVVKKCEGLPLSITVMGGLVAGTRSDRELEEALNGLSSQSGISKNHASSAIVELSYQHLSPQLKYCFLCLAFFNVDATIPVKRLLDIMVGQCFIEQIGRSMVEETARSYLNELINRNMVQAKVKTLDDRVKSCYLHDSLRMICLEKAEEEMGLQFLKRDISKSRCKPRHRVVQCHDFKSFPKDQNKHIRSLFVLNVDEDSMKIESTYWKSFKHLKILHLDGYYPLKKLPGSFKSLLGLKQFTVGRKLNKKSRESFYRDFFEKVYTPLNLLAWFDGLQYLELLDTGSESVEFPNLALEMDRLRHIRASRIFAPTSIGSMENVETLKYVRVEDFMKSSSKLIDGCNVRALGIFEPDDDGSRKHDSSTVRGSLEKLVNLVKLYLRWDHRLFIDPTIIPSLNSLTKIQLRGKISKPLTANMFPPNLSHLTLEMSCLDEDPIPELSKLLKLLYLKLKKCSYLGRNMQVLHDGFPSLTALSLQSLPMLRNVNTEEGGMPKLKLLQVYDCRDLKIENLSNKYYQLQILVDMM